MCLIQEARPVDADVEQADEADDVDNEDPDNAEHKANQFREKPRRIRDNCREENGSHEEPCAGGNDGDAEAARSYGMSYHPRSIPQQIEDKVRDMRDPVLEGCHRRFASHEPHNQHSKPTQKGQEEKIRTEPLTSSHENDLCYPAGTLPLLFVSHRYP